MIPPPDGAFREGFAGQDVEWRHDPWSVSPRRAGAALAASVALGWLAVRVAPVPLAGWALWIAILALAAPAFLPATCRVDERGVARRIGLGWERRDWAAIRRVRWLPDGLYVSTLAHGGPLEPFRGLLLPFSRAADPAFTATLRCRVEAHGH